MLMILYNKFYGEKPIPFRCFKESLIMSLTNGVSKEDLKPGKRSISTIGNVTDPGHKLVKADGHQKKLRKRCKGCYEIISQNEGRNEASRKAKKGTTYFNESDNDPYYCLSCFNIKHEI